LELNVEMWVSMQYFRRAANIPRILDAVVASIGPHVIEVIINNDSKSDTLALLRAIPYESRLFGILVYSNDLVRARLS